MMLRSCLTASILSLLVCRGAAAQPAPAAAASQATPTAPTPAAGPAPAPVGPAAEPGSDVPVAESPSAAADAPPPGDSTLIYVAQPPLPPLLARTRHYHDGFYLRLSVGAGILGVSSRANDVSYAASVSGGGGAVDLLVGGTPAPGLAIGGGVLLQEAFSPGYSLDGPRVAGAKDPSGPVGFWLLGPMIDAFPNPNGGFHVGGLVGLAGVGLKDTHDNASGGLGLSVWAGYMWWASSEWSLGGLVRLSGAWSERKLGDPAQVDVMDTTRAVTFMFSTAYH